MAFLSDKQEYCLESGQLELELHVALFSKKSKMMFESFKIFRTNFFEIDNCGILVCKKSNVNSLYFGLSKNKKSAKISNFCALFTRSRSMHLAFFLLSLKYYEFRIDFLHTQRSHNCIHQDLLS
jgi:hypothetical protein